MKITRAHILIPFTIVAFSLGCPPASSPGSTQAVATPVISPAAGRYAVASLDAHITCATNGASIYYTVANDAIGLVPTSSSPIYQGQAITAAGNGAALTVKAFAVNQAMSDSPIATATYTIDTGSSVFVRPADGSGTVFLSSWADPNGSDYDEYVYDDFTPSSDGIISQLLWRGAYMHDQLYTGQVWRFTITFYDSIAGGSQPHLTNPQLPEIFLAQYDITGSANESAAGSFGGKAMFDYQYYLPKPFHVAAGTKYWMRIQASQSGVPDWGIARGSGGDGAHFMFDTGAARFSAPGGDVAITLR
jgi:hypothetical protein